MTLYLVLAGDENRADSKDGKGVDHIKDSGIENGLMTEDGGDNGITHEPHITEHQGETDGSLIFLLSGHVTRQEEGDAGQYEIGDDADA